MNDVYAALFREILLPNSGFGIWIVIWNVKLIWWNCIEVSKYYAFPWTVHIFVWMPLWAIFFWIINVAHFWIDEALMSYPICFILIWSTSSWVVANLWPHLHRLLTLIDMCSLIMWSIALDISGSANPHDVQTHTCFYWYRMRLILIWDKFSCCLSDFHLITLDESIVLSVSMWLCEVVFIFYDPSDDFRVLSNRSSAFRIRCNDNMDWSGHVKCDAQVGAM